mgnify:CR=1 FL=1
MKDDDDVEGAEGLQLKISLSDNRPYTLYEVKQYVEDLLDRGWARKSCSAYPSPVVCVQKRDSSLRLCVNFHELKRRTVPDRHPLPWVQTSAYGAGGGGSGGCSPPSRGKNSIIQAKLMYRSGKKTVKNI